jgi:AraC family transcriptional regulator, activator of mtrCDE
MSDRSRETVLQSVLSTHPARVTIVNNSRYCGRWYEKEPQTERGQFHVIGEGECWVVSAALKTPVHLTHGDLVVFPRGSSHVLSSRPPDATAAPAATEEGGFTTMLCGELDFAANRRNPVLAALPNCFVVHSGDGGQAFRHLADLLIHTAHSGGFGQQLIMDKLAESLFVMAVCAFAEQSQDRRGLLAALSDTRLAKALAAMHTEPGRDWTVESLASVAGMSRTAFAVTFSEALGVSPFQYLTEWRIAEAKRLLQDRQLSVAAVAEQLGYQSEAAFRRTFKRVEGVGPGQIRRRP